jgi:hypothetical protein
MRSNKCHLHAEPALQDGYGWQDGVVVRAVFIFEGNDLSVLPSVERAAGHVEAIDVDNGEFDFFADDGTVLIGTTHDRQVMLRATDDRRPEELRERLRRYLSHPKVAMDPALADDPIAAAQAILDASWSRRPFSWLPWLDRRANGAAPPVV